MPLQFDEVNGNVVKIKASGKLTDEDYDVFVPHMEHLIDRWGRLRMLFDMQECDGWNLKGAWDELKFEAKHRKDLKRVAVVGDTRWAEWVTRMSKVFTGTDVRFYEVHQADEAVEWIEKGW